MAIFKTKTRRVAAESKDELRKATQCLTEEAIGYYAEADQSLVSGWLNPETDRHMQFFRIPLLPEHVAFPLIKWLASYFNADVVKRIPIVGTLDGKLDDEVMNITCHLGKIIETVRRFPSRKAEMALELDGILNEVNKARAEIGKPECLK